MKNKKATIQKLILIAFITITVVIVALVFLLGGVSFPLGFKNIALWIGFGIIFGFSINEGVNWIRNGKRSDWADLIAIGFLFIAVYLWTDNIMTSIIGAFSIYLIFGIGSIALSFIIKQK